VHHPGGEVADVDELDAALGRARREDLAAALEPVSPVGETPGRIVRADDQTGSHAQAALPEDLPDGLLAESLQRAVVRVVRGELVGRTVSERGDLALFVWADAQVRVDRHAGDEEVVAAVAEQLRRGPHDRRHVPGRIDHRVEGTTRQRR
jgi:hypothetical protein